LSWDEPLASYLPQLRFSEPYLFTELTLRDALSHRSGLERGDLAWYANPGISRDEVLAMIERLSLEQSFRSGFLYNNFMFLAAGQAIPAVTGQSWDEYLKQEIFEPLQMNRSNTSTHDLDRMENVATPHNLVDGKAMPIPWFNIDHIAPAGAINSSVSDMATH
jgi:CubicO group peptidase (beta-lactamase class C family)